MKGKWSLEISSGGGSYSVEEWGPSSFSSILQGNVVVLIDHEVSRRHADFIGSLGKNVRVIELTVDESLKNFDSLGTLIQQLINHGVDKTSSLVAVGGGALQDAVGFTASIYMRGVDWIFLPTTILSMGDSCIGSKTSINFYQHKNLLGNFNPPTKIIIRRKFLDSLESKDYWSGIGELCHYFSLDANGDELIDHVTEKRLDSLELQPFIQRSLEIKKGFIELDEYDQGPRKLLNFGHTFGHALEAATNYEIPHGIAVAWGARLAFNLSVKKNLLHEKSAEQFSTKMDRIIQRFTLPSATRDTFWDALLMDKKTVGGIPHAILTQGYGKMTLEPLARDFETLSAIDEALAILDVGKEFFAHDK